MLPTDTQNDNPNLIELDQLAAAAAAAADVRTDPVAERRECRCRRARHRHGTRDAYLRDRCRCRRCRAANNGHQRGFQRGRAVHRWHGTSPWVATIGARRRLQALTAAGWSTSQLATRLGVSKSAIAQLRSTGKDRMLAPTADTVAALYEDCWWRTPPGRYQARAERYAEARGWVPPWRWDGRDIDDPAASPAPELVDVDQVAVEEAIAGRRVPLTRAERRRVVGELRRRGVTAGEIARRVGATVRTVERDKAAGRVGDAMAGAA